MKLKNDFEAYLDDYNQIVIYLSKDSFGGKSSFFYLSDKDEVIHNLIIKSIHEQDKGFLKYEVTLKHELIIGEEYEIINEYGRSTILKYRFITKRERFDREFAYSGDDLGISYQKTQTVFKLWAPTANQVKLEIMKDVTVNTIEMNRNDNGVFECTVLGDLEYASYLYLVRVNGQWVETIDPYGIASTSNAKKSIVIDCNRIHKTKYSLPEMKNYCDAIIYELSVRDFTSQKGIGVTFPSTFLGLMEENKETIDKNTGFTYLKSLGVTHLQLMPILDFGSVNEKERSLFYNWGYDPVQFFTLEGSYGLDNNDHYSRIIEFSQLVEACHKAGIRVNIDIVMNHMYEVDKNPLQLVVPYYYVLMSEDGELSNGSFCGNDFDASRKMGRKMILSVCRYLIETFDIDGLRFDLMGILDIETMNQVSKLCHALKSDFMVYGEGWNMPSMLPYEKRACMQNEKKLVDIAYFSDYFREISKGFCCGNTSLIEAMKSCLNATIIDYGNQVTVSSPSKAIHYVECHDNHTCWDWLSIYLKKENYEVRMKCHIMLLMVTILSQGIPFLHSGQEFACTKQGRSNTYRDGDWINQIDYERRNQFHFLVSITKSLIQIRKNYSLFRLSCMNDIKKQITFEEIDHQVLIYHLQDDYNKIIVILNPTPHVFHYPLQGRFHLLFYYQEIKAEEKENDLVIDQYASIILTKYKHR